MIGSESAAAERVRKHRQNVKALQCNTDVTKCNTEIEKETEIEKDRNNIISIVDYLNSKTGKTFRYQTPKTQKHINARLSEGFTVDDFKTVIDKKTADWLKTDMERYLRPETLFGTKFEGYLNEKQGRNESHERNPGHPEPNRIGNYI